MLVELLPRHPGLERLVLLADAAVARDEAERELAEVARLHLPDPRGDEVVVEELHGGRSLVWRRADGLDARSAAAGAGRARRRSRTRRAPARCAAAGRRCRPWRVLLFATGIGLLLLAFASPIAAIGEQELFSFHMLQHVLIGDLAPLCLLAGLNGPMLRPLLAFRAGRAPARAREPFRGAAALGDQPLRLAPALPLRGRRRALGRARARAHVLLQRRDRRLAARARDAAGAGVVRHRPQARLHRDRPARRDAARQHLRLVGRRSSTASTTAATSSGGSRRCRIRGWRAR